MWKKIIFSIMLCSMLFSAVGCKKAEQTSGKDDAKVSVLPDDTYLPESSENTGEDTTSEPAKEVTDVTLYLPDENAEYLIPTVVQAEKTPEGVIEALVKQGALPEGTEVNYFTLKDNGQYISLEDEVASMSDKITGEIDLSDYFMEEVQHTGTAGESMLMGSVVNSMIDNFNLQSIMISANDEVIETGHCIYDEPQTFYQELIEE